VPSTEASGCLDRATRLRLVRAAQHDPNTLLIVVPSVSSECRNKFISSLRDLV